MKKFIPKSITRFSSRSILKARKNSPTILVVAGVVGFGATVVMAARASQHVQPVIDNHKKDRAEIGFISKTAAKSVRRDQQVQITQLYYHTATELAKVYGPTFIVGTMSTASILYGHNILRGRHVATMAAYSGLMEQFTTYRGRVRETLGERAEKDIYNGAVGEWVEDPDHKGEYKLQPKFVGDPSSNVLRPWFDETNSQFSRDPEYTKMWLTGVQTHMNNLFQIRGHMFLNEVLDALHMPRCADGQQLGWVMGNPHGDDFIDFGFMTDDDPNTVAFRNGLEKCVRLHFNVDGIVWDMI